MVKHNPISNQKAFIVIGLSYGDEGKGLVTDYLCEKTPNPIVIRFNGGQQAGHTVIHKSGKKHVFSNFGSGSLRSVPTYWSSYCTFSPAHFLYEYELLESKPSLFLDNNCAVTTHYDILFSQAVEISRGNERHGSCGLGFGATIERSKIANLIFTVDDLQDEQKCVNSLRSIRNYYREKFISETFFDFDKFSHDEQDEAFLNDVRTLKEIARTGYLKFCSAKNIFGQHSWETFVFEGAQGVLLDKDFGEPPYITKSNTTSLNATMILEEYFQANKIDIEVFYVTRAYATRHGAGPFWDNFGYPNLKNTESETNIENIFQGNFKRSFLDIEKLNHAFYCDKKFTANFPKSLVITCLDQLVDDNLEVMRKGTRCTFPIKEFLSQLDLTFNSVLTSYGSTATDISRFS